MKSYYYSTSPPSPAMSPPGKRRWRGLAVAVPALVLCSLLVPLAFLLGLHSHHRPGYGSEERGGAVISTELGFGAHKHLDGGREQKLLKGEDFRVDDLIRKFGPAIGKQDVSKKITTGPDGILGKKASGSKSLNIVSKAKHKGALSFIELKNITFKFKGPHTEKEVRLKDSSSWSSTDNIAGGKENHAQEETHNENPKSCQLEFGSYCLWSVEHKEVMKDAVVKRLKDQLFMARAHYPSIAKLKQQERFTRELKQNIQEHERMLSETISDADLPSFVGKKIEKMDRTIARAKACAVDCHNIERKLRQILDLTEDEAHFHMRQSAFLYHLGVQTMPKTHHCLTMRLTVEYFKSASIHMDQLSTQKLENPSFHHFVIFSRNILAVATTINSTVMNSKDSENMVFHLFTDGQNFYAMKHWFARNSYLEATVHAINIEDHWKLSHSPELQQLSPPEEFRVTVRNSSQPSPMQMRTEYLSVFGHSHFLLPDLLPSLKRVIVLEDDLIVQQDLSSLWNLDLGGKVIGAIQFCGVRLGQLKAYMGGYNVNVNSCSWMSGLNVIDLEKWRDLNITSVYIGLVQKLQKGSSEASSRTTALPISLLAFQDLIYPLEDSWVQSGLGYGYGITPGDLEKAAALHYNGVMKPWLDLGIHKYKSYWKKYITNGERFMTECNIHS